MVVSASVQVRLDAGSIASRLARTLCLLLLASVPVAAHAAASMRCRRGDAQTVAQGSKARDGPCWLRSERPTRQAATGRASRETVCRLSHPSSTPRRWCPSTTRRQNELRLPGIWSVTAAERFRGGGRKIAANPSDIIIAPSKRVPLRGNSQSSSGQSDHFIGGLARTLSCRPERAMHSAARRPPPDTDSDTVSVVLDRAAW